MRKGFTLIELIFVIVILGILAAVALPRFANVSEDARTAKQSDDVGAIKSAIQQVRAVAILDNNTSNWSGSTTDTGVYVDGTLVRVDKTSKYPVQLSDPNGAGGASDNADANFSAVLDESPANWQFDGTSGNQFTSPKGDTFTYSPATGKFTN